LVHTQKHDYPKVMRWGRVRLKVQETGRLLGVLLDRTLNGSVVNYTTFFLVR
jgi:hypothetical protein